MVDEDFNKGYHRQRGKKLQELVEKGKRLVQQIGKLRDASSYGKILDDPIYLHALKWLQRDAEDDLDDDLIEPRRNFKRELSLGSIIRMVESIEEVTMDRLTKAGTSQSIKREYGKLLWINQELRKKIEDFQKKIISAPHSCNLQQSFSKKNVI